MADAASVIKDLKKLGSPAKAKASAWFFKTAPGQYGHGDIFVGGTVPQQRLLAKKYKTIPLKEVDKLLKNKIHECRLTALLILDLQYQASDEKQRDQIIKFYLARTKYVNNWDLVDSSASYILGDYLLNKDKKVLYKFARSRDLWERRIAIIATYAFIKQNKFNDTLKIAEILLPDTHDLIHKASGWMLREVGNRSLATEEQFLKKYAAKMPRTMLRYAIEKFPEKKRQAYLKRA